MEKGEASSARWIGTAEAADRLGVKPATLYAYVSRGGLRRRRSPDGRSLFDANEVERMARRGRPRRGPGASELVIASRVTELGEDRPYYRGRDALELARTHHLEAVADLLWTGTLAATVATWRAAPEALAAGRAAQSGLPPDVLPLERLRVVAAALATTDPLRLTLDPGVIADVGRNLIAGMVECMPGKDVRGPIASRLWTKLGPGPTKPGLVDALRSALVLLADHELAASTLAARVAASVGADPYAVVSAGLGAMGGARHGGASLRAEAMLAEVPDPGQASKIVGLRLRRGEYIPGFGHAVYRGADGRATALLDRIRAAAPEHRRLAVADAILADARRRRLPEPNIDFALAVLTDVAKMTIGVGEVIFAVARTVGWLAHAIEEYENPTHLRPRATPP